jgi:glutamate synthase (NADPH/NADH) small chain
VGSGPAGLACADELAKLGYAVTVFEAHKAVGGLLVNGIPAFKLDKDVVRRRVQMIEQRGVVFQTNLLVGRDVSFEELRRRHDALFLGVGACKPKTAGVPGEELAGVFAALPFLVQYNAPEGYDWQQTVDVRGKRVAVLGGGDTAMDCLRTALRAGARKSTCIYRRDLANMPGSRKEYYNAIEEGAEFEFLTNPVAIEANAFGSVGGVRVVSMELGEPDAQGRRKPVEVPGSERLIEADVVLVAYGFDPAGSPLFAAGAELEVDRWGALKVDKQQMTSMPGVFAGGDSSRGASLVVHAVRDGRAAACGIDAYLGAPRPE